MSTLEVILQQFITGIANGLIIALIALGYSMVYGIVDLINFAHGDLFMLGCFCALTIVGYYGDPSMLSPSMFTCLILTLFVCVPAFCGIVNLLVDRFAYRPIRSSPKLIALIAAIGVSFVFLNIGLFWGGLPMKVFGNGVAASAAKDFPALFSYDNILGEQSNIYLSVREIFVFLISIPLLIIFGLLVKFSKIGIAMRAVAQNPTTAKLMGINVDRTINFAFICGGVLGGVASIVYCVYNNTVFYQMGYRVGIDAFSAAVVGGIGNLFGACFGGILIGIVRALSDQYIGTNWTNITVFVALIAVLIFRPQGILGVQGKEKV